MTMIPQIAAAGFSPLAGKLCLETGGSGGVTQAEVSFSPLAGKLCLETLPTNK